MNLKKKKNNAIIEILKSKRGFIKLDPITFMLMSMLIMAVTLIVIVGKPVLDHGDKEEYRQSIVALGSGSEVKGDFYLGSGNVDSVSMYKYMIKEKDGAMSMKVAPASESKIYYIEDGEPYVEIEKENSYGEVLSEYKFYIPEGSVRENIEINLED